MGGTENDFKEVNLGLNQWRRFFAILEDKIDRLTLMNVLKHFQLTFEFVIDVEKKEEENKVQRLCNVMQSGSDHISFS